MTPRQNRPVHVVVVPPGQPARVELVTPDDTRQLYALLGCSTMDMVTLESTRHCDLNLLVDDMGGAKGCTPHLWARGAVIHGTAVVALHSRRYGRQVDIPQPQLDAILEVLNSKAPARVFWAMVPFARIAPDQVPQAYAESERLRDDGLALFQQQNPDAFIVVVDETPPYRGGGEE